MVKQRLGKTGLLTVDEAVYIADTSTKILPITAPTELCRKSIRRISRWRPRHGAAKGL
jgi:hypothetical protein